METFVSSTFWFSFEIGGLAKSVSEGCFSELTVVEWLALSIFGGSRAPSCGSDFSTGLDSGLEGSAFAASSPTGAISESFEAF